MYRLCVLVVTLLGSAALDPLSAIAQDPVRPPPLAEFTAWLGMEPGRTLAYRSGGEKTACVRVEETPGGLALDGFPWPGTDDPLDLVVPTGDRPALGWTRDRGPGAGTISPLLPAGAVRRGAAPDLDAGPLAAPPGAPLPVGWPIATRDGWYALGGTAESPHRLVYVRCTACTDAGLRVVFERGRGIVSVRATSIDGPSYAVLADRGCEAEEAGQARSSPGAAEPFRAPGPGSSRASRASARAHPAYPSAPGW